MNLVSLRAAQSTALLRNRSFLALWVAQAAAIAAIYGLGLAGATLVEEQTRSSMQTSLVIISAVLPGFLGSLVAGPVIDRRGRKRVLVASLMARGTAALAFWVGAISLPPAAAIAVVNLAMATGTAFTQFATPAELAMLPDLVDHENLVPANALLQLGTLVAEGLGIVFLSPLLIKVAGPAAVGLASTLLCLLAVILVVGLPSDPPLSRRPGLQGSLWKTLWSDFSAGWLAITRDRLLRMVAIYATLAATLLLVLLSLLPGLLARHLGLGVANAPLLLLPGGLGFVLGAVALSRWETALTRPAWIGVGLTGFGVCVGLLALLSQVGSAWLILPLVFLLGLALAPTIITARVVLQEHPPAAVRGRVIAAQLALANAAAVAPLLLGGSLADRWGIQPVMVVLALLALCAGIAALFQARHMATTR